MSYSGKRQGRERGGTTMATRRAWAPVIERAAQIVDGSELPMTLRQLFYRLVSEELIENHLYRYQDLSRLTAKGRRAGTFPRLIDPTRQVYIPPSWDGPEDARGWLREQYRRDRTEGQPYQIILAVEKATQFGFLRSWFGDLGVPIATLRGFDSQTHVDEVAGRIRDDPRPTVLLYAGDFDPSGDDIERDFRTRIGPALDGAVVRRVALDWAQVDLYKLPPQMVRLKKDGTPADSRADAFLKRHGRLVQVELEALPPQGLRDLYAEEIAKFWDRAAYKAVRVREEDEREEL